MRPALPAAACRAISIADATARRSPAAAWREPRTAAGAEPLAGLFLAEDRSCECHTLLQSLAPPLRIGAATASATVGSSTFIPSMLNIRQIDRSRSRVSQETVQRPIMLSPDQCGTCGSSSKLALCLRVKQPKAIDNLNFSCVDKKPALTI